MTSSAADRMHKINELRDNVARDLSGMLRDLEEAKLAFGSVLQHRTGISALPTRQTYVLEYRDDAEQSRIAVIRTVMRKSEDVFDLFNTSGQMITLRADQIEGWEPVLRRDNEPLPDGWWQLQTP